MTISFARFALLVLLAVAVPIQGLAAVAAGQCMAFGHHQDAGEAPPEHHSHDDGADGHPHAAEKQVDENQSAHCGPCTACCASASMAAPPPATMQTTRSHVEYGFSQLPPPGVALQRFDRPPLSL